MSERLAVEGGTPVRSTLLPYGRHSIDDADIAAVTEALRSAWLTTGPRVEELERGFAQMAGVQHAVAVNSGTAALHAALAASSIGATDEVIVPAITFAASSNAALYVGAKPVFADVDAETLLLTAETAERCRTARTKAVIAVDFAGQPCDYATLVPWARAHGIVLIADACHALGGRFHGRTVGGLADASTFSLHPVKAMTTGEGGVITTDDGELARRARRFRNHGIDTDHREREKLGTWAYDMVELGFNYRLSDINCALGVSQLAKVPAWRQRRAEIAAIYERAFAVDSCVAPLVTRPGIEHGHHLFAVRLRSDRLRVGRPEVFAALRAEGIGVAVHYRPVYLMSHYRSLGYAAGACPVAEAAYDALLSLPMFPAMSDQDAADVIAAVRKVGAAYAL